MFADTNVVCPILIGRSASLESGVHALTRAHTGHGGTVLISGEAGIGKSRLTHALVDRARETGFVTLGGACFEADRAHPYAPILDLVRVLASVRSPALAAHWFARAAADLVTLFPELQSIFVEATPRATLSPEEDRRRLFQSFTDSVHAIARVQPLLLVIEDVHWSDDATLDLLLHLARRITSQPIAILLTFRSDEIGQRLTTLLAELDRARCATEIALRPLDSADVSAMLEAIFGDRYVLDAAFSRSLHSLTEGNPFFVEEVLKALLESGDIAQTDGVWRARPLAQLQVPRTATEAVGRRLAALSDAARRVAAVAAVAGRRFDFAMLQTLTQHEDAALLALIKELIDAQLVVEESADRFAFRHALTRESIRVQLLLRERVALHRAIADALEARWVAGAHDLDDDLAYHAFEGGAWHLARRHARRAADHAWTLCAPREALQQLDRAVTATQRAGAPADAQLHIERGRAYETLGAFQPAHEDFTLAHDVARDAGDRAASWLALHSLGLLWAARDYERAGQYRRDALALARSLDDPSLIARSLNRVGNWYVNREEPQSGIPYHDEALAIFEHAQDRHGVAETVDLLAMSHHIAGTADTAVMMNERAIGLFTELGDRRGLANALSVLLVSGSSHHASAVAVCGSVFASEQFVNERAVQLAVDIGWRAGEAFARYLLADCLSWRGEYARALKLARESLVIAQELEHLEWQCGAHRVLGVTAHDLGDIDEALAQLDVAHDIARRLGSATWIRWTGAPLAIRLARSSYIGAAASVLNDVDRIVTGSGAAKRADVTAHRTLGTRHIALARAEVALATGEPEQALTLLPESDTLDVPRAGLLRSEILAALGQWDDATRLLIAARVEAERQSALPLMLRIDAMQGTVWLGQRRRLDARQSFDSARAIADALCATLDDAGLAATFRVHVDLLAPPPPAPTARKLAKEQHFGLTPREHDTAALIAAGKSNRHIAQVLGIGERTVEGYVAGVMSKLRVTSRAQIALWAVEHGLARGDPHLAKPRR